MRTILGGVLGKIPRPTPAMVVALLALLIAASGAAVAAIPSNGTITACYSKSNGALRVIDAGQTCNSKETQLAWKDGSTLLGKNEKAADSDKLDNKDSTEFLGANQKAADSENLDGLDSAAFAKSYDHTVVVSPDNTAERSGVSLLNALSNITDASAFNRYLIHLEPGTYYLGEQGSQSLQMKPFVDIEGSGQNMTRITSNINDADCGFDVDATVQGASDAELRFLTVENYASSSSGCDVAIANNGDVGRSLSPTLTFVSAISRTGGFSNIGIHNRFASPTLTNVTAKAEEASGSFGVFTRGGSSRMTFKDSTLSSLATSSGTTTIVKDSTLLGYLSNDGTTKVANSQLLGAIENRVNGATLQCFNNYDENMAPVTCP